VAWISDALVEDALRRARSGLAEWTRDDLPLSRREREMIQTVVSAANRCFH
jgi:hypothetical protein